MRSNCDIRMERVVGGRRDAESSLLRIKGQLGHQRSYCNKASGRYGGELVVQRFDADDRRRSREHRRQQKDKEAQKNESHRMFFKKAYTTDRRTGCQRAYEEQMQAQCQARSSIVSASAQATAQARAESD